MKPITKILISIFAVCVTFGLFFSIDYEKTQIVKGAYCVTDADCPSGQKCVGGEKTTEGGLAQGTCEAVGGTPESQPTEGGAPGGAGGAGGEGAGDYGLSAVTGLPKGEISDVIIRVIRYVLGLVGVVLFAMLIYGGFMYMTSAGNEEQVKKAKNVLTYAIVGIVIIAMAFLITEFIIGALGGG